MKVKATSLTILLITVFLAATLSGIQFIKEASAIPYTQYTGTLDGADWALQIPDPWNGMLVMVCHGYNPNIVNPLGPLIATGIPDILNQGFAVAASNFGVAGFCIADGVDSTYQLTMHIIDNYNVSGRVFLVGMSMGGGIALLLGEKYPEIYSGVLDLFGTKDLKVEYTRRSNWASLTDEELSDELLASGIPVPPPGFTDLASYRPWLDVSAYVLETGGTPATVPQAYEDRSPTYHANIEIPVITIHGTGDPVVLLSDSVMYQDAVAAAGHSSMYRLYTVADAGHGVNITADERVNRFDELVEWSNYLTGVYDWPIFGYDVQNTGCTESMAPDTNQTLWTTSFSIGGGVTTIVADGRLFFGAWDSNVYCLNAATGTQIWNYTTGGMVSCTAAFADGKVYVGSTDDNLYCLDAENGTKIWNFTGDNWGFRGAPTIVDGRVYAGSDDTNIYCLNATTGVKIWNYTTGNVVITFPAVADGKVYLGSNDTNVYCLDTLTGAKVWNYTTGDHVLSGPTVVDGKVFVGSYDGKVYCLNAATGTQIWNCTTGGAVFTSPTIAYGKVYVGSFDDNLYCLNMSTGIPIWVYTTGGNIFGAPAVADGKVYLGSSDTNVYCLDAASGTLIWRYSTVGVSYHGPAIANGVVYIIGGTNVYAIGEEYLIPEGFGVEVVLLLSAAVAVFSFSLLPKRSKWKKNQR